MEEAISNFSTVFTTRKCTICFHDVEHNVTDEKCLIRGHMGVLPERCPRDMSLQTFSE